MKPNIYKLIPKKYLKDNYINPNYKLPIKHPFRLCIIGASGTGKTQALIWMIEESKAFHKIYLYAKKLDEPLYEFLIDSWEKRSKKQKETLIEYSDDINEIVHLKDIDESIQNLIIFDDFIVERDLKQVEELFIRGRKSNCSITFISQSYYIIPSIARQNSNYFILTHGIDGRNLINIAIDHSGSVDNNKFKAMYRKFTKDENFMLIDVIKNKFYQNLGLD